MKSAGVHAKAPTSSWSFPYFSLLWFDYTHLTLNHPFNCSFFVLQDHKHAIYLAEAPGSLLAVNFQVDDHFEAIFWKGSSQLVSCVSCVYLILLVWEICFQSSLMNTQEKQKHPLVISIAYFQPCRINSWNESVCLFFFSLFYCATMAFFVFSFFFFAVLNNI